ncbi:MAG TPA: hypothetical protein VJK53_03435 [Candidatus Paceibacterota bacterium]
MKLAFIFGSYAAFAALLLGFSGEAIKMAHETAALANVHEVRNALEIYNVEHGVYPTELSNLVPNYLTIPTNGSIENLRYAQTAGGATYSLKIASN